MTLHDDNKLQRMEVLRIMADQQWRTLPQLSSALGNRYMITSLSARLRDFRKEQFGSYRVEQECEMVQSVFTSIACCRQTLRATKMLCLSGS